jgi:exopolysaccharide biosynthesis polyprenyl glycosylphosphotransferase
MQNKKKIHFEVSERKILLRVFDVLFVIFSLYIVGEVFSFNYFYITSTNFYWTILLSIYIVSIGTIFEMYNLQIASNQFQIIRSIVLTSLTTVLVYLLTPYFTPALPNNRIQILFFFLAIFFALLIWRIFYQKFLASQRFQKKVILICENQLADELIAGLKNIDPHYTIVAVINSNDEKEYIINNKSVKVLKLENLRNYIGKVSISEIVIATQNTDEITVSLYNELLFLLENGFVIREYTQVYESLTQRIPVQFVSRDFYKYFPFSRSNQNKLYLFSTRFFEVMFALLGLSISVFILPLIFLGNLCGNRGKMFYSQIRVGKNGQEFSIFKFRTMVKNAESQGAVFATTNDARITPFGKFLRKTRLDELPQFYNILKGEMAVIGPRPERPVFVNKIAEIMPFYQTRHVVKPGLTGWAQVNYSYGDSIEDSLIKLQYDLYYIKHRSIFLDFNIVIKTLSTVLFFRGQ